MLWLDWRQISVWRIDDERTASDHSSQAIFLLGSMIADGAMACSVWATSLYPITFSEKAGKIRVGVYVCFILELALYLFFCVELGVSLFPKAVEMPS
jgi:hypothetical protein